MPTSPRAILHHTDPNAPNISGGSVQAVILFRIQQTKFHLFEDMTNASVFSEKIPP